MLGEEEITYTTQLGDTLPALAGRFKVPAGGFLSDVALSPSGLLPIGAPIKAPNNLEDLLPYHNAILPDSELIYGPSVGDFNAADFAREAGGFLATYSEDVNGQRLSGPEIVHWVALETSTNPRLLLAFLEYRSGWVYGSPLGASTNAYPIGFGAADKWLRNELMITAKLLAQGFYGWRDGSFTELKFYGGLQGRLSPGLNAGSVGLMQLVASLYEKDESTKQLIDSGEFLAFYQDMFGNYWDRGALVEPYLLATTSAPDLVLPFAIGEVWSLTGGPHISW